MRPPPSSATGLALAVVDPAAHTRLQTFLLSSFFFFMVTLINTIQYVSRGQFSSKANTHCVVCPPPTVRLISVAVYVTPSAYLPPLLSTLTLACAEIQGVREKGVWREETKRNAKTGRR